MISDQEIEAKTGGRWVRVGDVDDEAMRLLWEQARKAPVWVFTSSAMTEIEDFVRSLSDGEWNDIVENCHPPQFVNVVMNIEAKGKRASLGCLFRISPQWQYGDPRDDRFETYWKEDVIDQWRDRPEVINTLGSMSLAIVVVRSLFKDRFIERLTKHQQRALRKYGSLPDDARRVIDVAWDAPTMTYTRALDILTTPEVVHTPRGAVCEHEVKGHPRHYRSGKVVWVSPHRRGDPNVPRKTITRIVSHDGH